MKAIFLISCLLIVGYSEFEFSDITNLGNTIVDGVVSAEHQVENFAKEGIDAIGNAINSGVNFVTGQSKPVETPQAATVVEPPPTSSPVQITPQPVIPKIIIDPVPQPLPELTAVPLMIRGIPVTSENMAGVVQSMNQQVELIELKAKAADQKIEVTLTPVEKVQPKEESTSEDIEEEHKKKSHHKESAKVEKKHAVDEEKVKKHAEDLKAKSGHEHKQMKESKMSHEEWKQKKEEKAKKIKSYHDKHQKDSKKQKHDRKEFTSAELLEMWAKKHNKVPKNNDQAPSISESKEPLSLLSISDLEVHAKFSTSNLRSEHP